jgi:ribosome biogenesis protein MAK21
MDFALTASSIQLLNAAPGLRDFLFNNTVGVGDDNRSSAMVANPRYDPLKRSPAHAHASASPLCELYPLRTHYHPTVALFAKRILDGDPLPLTALCEGGVPDLGSHTLVSFLDKFVFKNPKKKSNNLEARVDGGGEVEAVYGRGKGGSLMQPAASASDGVKLIKGERGEKSVNEKAWWKLRAEDVPVDEVGLPVSSREALSSCLCYSGVLS